MQRTLRRTELTEKVCGVPYAAQNWPKKCAAYPAPHRTDPKSVRRTLRRIELAKRVCGVPYAAKNWPKKCAAYPTPHTFFHVATSARLHLLPFAFYVSWCAYHIAVIHSKARGWPVQRSLPRVTIRGRKLPPWGLYPLPRTTRRRDNVTASETPMLRNR